ncbi:MAG TPA: helix-turn-helix domain-containing protein [Aquabacterium sp.]|uniref:TetR/AcrR family transcriptional regulator n=1 Tax=Aquabacterium sp. TaxID=1872578 RepID=UPI002E2F4138|nr:helix-turn-helix domain-containing protein [Aquabacterium sp.]HEX5356674.1 helix-turn-helix domain-containing protein [Aquabacterium sp.]
MARLPFKQQVLQAREDAIIDAVNRLLAEKGFDLMTVDAVAAEVGIAKASLYKHFDSKEALAGAAMKRLLTRSMAQLDLISQADHSDALSRIKAVVRWTMEVQLAGEMPSLPSQNSSLRASLMADMAYMTQLITVSERLGGWISEAQAAGLLTTSVPAEVVLYTLFARACDPVLGVLKAGGHAPEQIIEWVLSTTFEGLARR